jgi:hypothetical protein
MLVFTGINRNLLQRTAARNSAILAAYSTMGQVNCIGACDPGNTNERSREVFSGHHSKKVVYTADASKPARSGNRAFS